MKISKSPQEIRERQPIAKGIYEGEIIDAYDDHSQAGTEMIVSTVELRTASGEVVGRLIDRVTEKIAGGQKLLNFCQAFGLMEAYEGARELRAADVVGRTARCEVIIKRSAKYGTRNEIVSYICGPVLASSSEPRTGTTS